MTKPCKTLESSTGSVVSDANIYICSHTVVCFTCMLKRPVGFTTHNPTPEILYYSAEGGNPVWYATNIKSTPVIFHIHLQHSVCNTVLAASWLQLQALLLPYL